MGILRLVTSRAMIVPRPDVNRVTLTSNLVRMATSTVAGNMVSTCWKPRLSIMPQGGVSSGMKPRTLLLDFVSAAITFSSQGVLGLPLPPLSQGRE